MNEDNKPKEQERVPSLQEQVFNLIGHVIWAAALCFAVYVFCSLKGCHYIPHP